MPLSFADIGSTYLIKEVTGKQETKQHLENLGFVVGEPVKIDDLAKNLIRLSGYTPNVDMMIQYTGLRPGEKLYEELLMAEEGMQDTENKMIHIGKPIEMDEEKFMLSLTELKDACNQNADNIKELVSKIVTTYHYQA